MAFFFYHCVGSLSADTHAAPRLPFCRAGWRAGWRQPVAFPWQPKGSLRASPSSCAYTPSQSDSPVTIVAHLVSFVFIWLSTRKNQCLNFYESKFINLSPIDYFLLINVRLLLFFFSLLSPTYWN